MKTTKTYPDGCRWCNATGFVKNTDLYPGITNEELIKICPICLGSKTIMIVEVTETKDNNINP